MNPRKFSVEIAYNGIPATKEIIPYFNSFTFTDAIDESDTISLSLIDREGTWKGSWIPKKEDRIFPNIILENWLDDQERRTILCGDFLVDDFSFSGPPDMLSINGISSPLHTDFKETSRSQTWANVTLQQVGMEISGRYGLELIFDGTDISIAKIEQSRQSDGDFLKKLAEKYGFALKVYAGKLVLFEWDAYEKKPVKGVIRKTDVRKWNYKSSMLGTYTGAKVSYTVPNKKETIEIMVGKEGRLYSVNEKADSPADAERIGKNAIRSANRKETTISFTWNPVFFFNVGDKVQLEGFGSLNGIYQIGKIVHQITPSDYSIQVSGWAIPEVDSQENSEQPQEASGTRYIVQRGDTLWDLSSRFYGDSTQYGRIYQANKEVIEQEARKRGKKDSSSGYWIFPGTELLIP